MSPLAALLVTVVLSYLLGAAPFGYLVARAHRVDIFHQGSGNIGATNVGRVLGWRVGVLVFCLDFAKGAVPAAVARVVPVDLPPHTLPVAAGLAAFVGHVFPVYLGFRGGKGVATATGVVSVLLPVETLAALVVWLVVVAISRYMSLASLSGALALCLTHFALRPLPFAEDEIALTLLCLIAAALVLARHRTNLGRLVHGSENRLKDTEAMFTLTRTSHLLALGLGFGRVAFFTLL